MDDFSDLQSQITDILIDLAKIEDSDDDEDGDETGSSKKSQKKNHE